MSAVKSADVQLHGTCLLRTSCETRDIFLQQNAYKITKTNTEITTPKIGANLYTRVQNDNVEESLLSRRFLRQDTLLHVVSLHPGV